jgi:hypothetical protein
LELFPQTVTSYYLSSIDAISYSSLDNHNVVVSFFSKVDGILKMKEWYIIPYEEWPPFVWELYEKEGITLDGPTPIEEIRYPVKNSE